MTSIKIPNLKELTKTLTPKFNQHLAEIVDDSKKWIGDFLRECHLEKYQKVYDGVLNEVFVSYAWPQVSPKGLRAVLDVCNVMILYDDISEKNLENGKKYSAIFRNVTKDLNHVDGKSGFGSGLKKIYDDIRNMTTPHKFIILRESFLEFFDAVLKRSENRENKLILNYEEYRKERIIDIGFYFILNLGIITNGVDIREEIAENEDYKKLLKSAGENLFIINDIFSFFAEYRENLHDMNIVTVLMKEENLSMQNAFDKAGAIFETNMKFFFECKKEILSQKTCDDDVKKLIEWIEDMLSGTIEWSLQTKRYSN